jgi:hypothetical protein
MEGNKPTCFVIQQFDDGGTFDKRYAETIRPALLAAEVEPKRADAILGLQPIVEKIETAIQEAAICVADVSTDNPNVWLELGYALALDRPVVILCDKQMRQKLPFDIQHRPVVFYRTDSKSGYEELERNIVKFVKNQIEKESKIINAPLIKSGSHVLGEFKDYEVAILTTLLALWPTSASGGGHWELEKKLSSMGYEGVALGLGVAKLLDEELIQQKAEEDINGEIFYLYQITPNGISWLRANEDQLEIKNEEPQKMFNPDDEIPF